MINFSCHVEVDTFNAYVERLEICAEMNCGDPMKENVLVVVGKNASEGEKRKNEMVKKEKIVKGRDLTGDRVEQIEEISVLP